ncbi:unnamed protein product, partial [Medioppia subpectinata]
KVLAKDDNDRHLHKGLSDRSVENCVSRQESLFPTNCINHCTFMFKVNIFSSFSIKIASFFATLRFPADNTHGKPIQYTLLQTLSHQ